MSQREIILIAHRGNSNGPNPERENSLPYLQEALDRGFDVEADIRYVHGDWYLGHDGPKYKIDEEWLELKHIWWHAKDTYTLMMLLPHTEINHFYQQSDVCSLTSQNYIWTVLNRPGPKNIIVIPACSVLPKGCAGLCSDYVGKLKGIPDAECSDTNGGYG